MYYGFKNLTFFLSTYVFYSYVYIHFSIFEILLHILVNNRYLYIISTAQNNFIERNIGIPTIQYPTRRAKCLHPTDQIFLNFLFAEFVFVNILILVHTLTYRICIRILSLDEIVVRTDVVIFYVNINKKVLV